MKSRRKDYREVILTEQIPILQEIAFVKNRSTIEDYVDNKKQKELQEYRQLEVI